MQLKTDIARWETIRGGLALALDRFRDDDLEFVPFEGSWVVGRIALHIASAEEGWFRHVVTGELEE